MEKNTNQFEAKKIKQKQKLFANLLIDKYPEIILKKTGHSKNHCLSNFHEKKQNLLKTIRN